MKWTYETGLLGEEIATQWLEEHYGMRLLESRYKTNAGEIDLIMMDRETVVFVEVKTRLNAAPGTGMLAVNRSKQNRIARAAALYLIGRGWQDRPVRFDIAEVTGYDVMHVPNAFQPGGMFY